ncbi:NAD(+) synthase [uncultured Mobiluncus sp.]|uniref:NAD(+) synthase n=1 Tax=uncultured Mobiluncus sp. TaxID=293425 RepID=UPI0025E2A43C|nr:NAD(+) synthase [uncultured Mobiluncus sp.]
MDNIYAHGIARVASATFTIQLGDPHANARQIVELARAAAAQHAALVVFPQDCLTGVTLGDWGANTAVANATVSALHWIATQTADLSIVTIVGARLGGVSRAVSIWGGEAHDDLDQSWGFSATNLPGLHILPVVGSLNRLAVADNPAPVSFYTRNSFGAAMSGNSLPTATVIAHLAAPAHTVGSTRHLHRAARTLSRDLHLAVVQTIGSHGESSTDGAYSASGFIAADGQVLAAETHLSSAGLTLADIVLPELARGVRYTGPGYTELTGYGNLEVALDLDTEIPLLEPPAQRPLVPVTNRRYRADLREAFDIQRDALVQRLEALGNANIVLGISGGLDSTLALLVAMAACDSALAHESPRQTAEPNSESNDLLSPAEHLENTSDSALAHESGRQTAEPNRESNDCEPEILTFTMPGFATSEHTKDNAQKLAAAVGVSCELIDIRPTATEMLKTMGHPAGHGEAVYDITFENVQAGLRSDYLFRLANQRHGFVLGTGDLSESALGWTTYGVGDHMSHYSVNCGVPKSMMPDLIREAAAVLIERELVADPAGLLDTVESIIATDVTPELIPDHDSGGQTSHQTTEGSIGPYLLHDFFLYHTLRGAGPDLVGFLALAAFTKPAGCTCPGAADKCQDTGDAKDSTDWSNEGRYFTREEVLKWLEVFYRRFLTQQYKRSASVDGPVIWEGMTLSPRAGFKFPSDLSPAAALAQLKNL